MASATRELAGVETSPAAGGVGDIINRKTGAVPEALVAEGSEKELVYWAYRPEDELLVAELA